MSCPKCNSDQLSGDTQGFGAGKAISGLWILGPLGLLFGLFNRKRTKVRCLACGHRWDPARLKRQKRGKAILIVIANILFPPLLLITVPWWLVRRRAGA